MTTPVIGQPLIGVTVGAAPTAPATRPPGVIEQGKVNTDALIADLAKRIQRMEGDIEQMVPGDRIPSLLRLTKGAAFLSADQIALLGTVTMGDYVRDLAGNPTAQIDPKISQVIGNKIRTGVITNFAGDAWMNLDAGRPGFDNTFLRVRNGVRMDADGYLQLGSNPGKQLVYDPWTGIFSIGDQVLAAGQTMGSIAANANWGASRPVGDLTAQVLANSGTTIVSQAGTLFDFTNGAFRLQVGAGGITTSYAGQPTLAMSSMGSAVYSGDLITGGKVQASGATTDPTYGTAAIVGYAPSNGYGVMGIVSDFHSLGGVLGIGNGPIPGGVFGNGGGGVALFAERTSVGSLTVRGGYGVFTPLDVTGNAKVSGAFTVSGAASFNDAYFLGNTQVSSLNGFSSPNNILAFSGIGAPSNTTTPAGFMQVRTLSGAIANVPYHI